MRFIFTLVLSMMVISSSWASTTKTMCVFDPMGRRGEVFGLMRDYAIEMANEGVRIQLDIYTDEGVAINSFRSGQCDIASATDVRLRELASFSGTISAMGALPGINNLRTLLLALNRPRAAQYLDDGHFSVVGILPLGPGYLFTDDREVDTVEELSGRKISVLYYQPDAMAMTRQVGATPVPSDVMTFAGKFNNGQVNICYAPAMAYSVFELYKGLNHKGGIIRYPLGQLTYQLISRSQTFTADQEKASRLIAYRMFDKAYSIVRRHEAQIDEKYWIAIKDQDIAGYQEMFRQSRMAMKKDGIYSGKMLAIMRKIRCIDNLAAAECSNTIARE